MARRGADSTGSVREVTVLFSLKTTRDRHSRSNSKSGRMFLGMTAPVRPYLKPLNCSRHVVMAYENRFREIGVAAMSS